MWCAILLLTTVEVCVDAQLTLTPCVADTVNGASVRVAEVRRGQTSQLHCRGLAARHTVSWTYLPDGGGRETSLGYCFPLTGSPAGCFAGQPGIGFSQPTRPSDFESVMTVDTRLVSAEGYVQIGALECRPGINSATEVCLMDLIDPAEGTCSVKFERNNADEWVATGSCSITSAYSSRGRYSCHWFRARDSAPDEFQSTVSYIGSSGVCKFNQALPPVGQYSYRVRITPGEVIREASFGSNSNQISTPTAPTVSGCSSDSYIEENSPVSCTCSTTSLGQPAGSLVWRRVGVASPVASGDYGNNRLVVPLTLLRGDHGVTQFRCDVDWGRDVSGSLLTFKVGYEPEGLSLSLNSGLQTEITVRENATVTLTCLADSRPVATMTVHKDGVTSPVSSGPSPLTLTLDPARCADTGTYVCLGSNQFGQPDSPVSGKVYVTCSPRSVSTDLPALSYINESIGVTFDVTAYPSPSSPFTFTGPGLQDPPSSPSYITFDASCRPKAARMQHLFVCTVTVLEMTSKHAAGAYIVSITNSEGSQLYRFNVTYNGATTPSAGKKGVDTVTVALAVVLGVVVIALIVTCVVCGHRRRRKAINAADHYGNPINCPVADHYDTSINCPAPDHYDIPINCPAVDHYYRPINCPVANHYETAINSEAADHCKTPIKFTAADNYLTPINPPTADHNESSVNPPVADNYLTPINLPTPDHNESYVNPPAADSYSTHINLPTYDRNESYVNPPTADNYSTPINLPTPDHNESSVNSG